MVARDPRLIIDVDALGAEGWDFDDVLAAEQVTALLNEAGPAEVESAGPLTARLHAYKAGEGLRVEGTAAVTLSRPCSRCLAPSTIHVALDLKMTLFPATVVKTHSADPPAEAPAPGAPRRRRRGPRPAAADPRSPPLQPEELDDVQSGTYSAGKADLEEVLREAILLEIPFANLCREDCRGLCPRCGQDLNAGPCGCQEKPADPRWAALKEVKLD